MGLKVALAGLFGFVHGSWLGFSDMFGFAASQLAVPAILPPHSACRAVWYCGTACSHADWRAGHKRVCKALATARQAEKEARQQQG